MSEPDTELTRTAQAAQTLTQVPKLDNKNSKKVSEAPMQKQINFVED